MARKSFKAGALTAPLPPVMVTVGDMENSNIITIGWTGILSTIPPRTYISVRPERHSYKLLKATGEFVINLTTAKQAREVDYVGIYTGAKVDKFKECGFTKEKATKINVPMIGECPISIECRVTDVISLGSHDMFLADILAVNVEKSLLEGEKLCINRAHLCAFAHGEYYKLGERIGKFGFSVKKKKMPQRKK